MFGIANRMLKSLHYNTQAILLFEWRYNWKNKRTIHSHLRMRKCSEWVAELQVKYPELEERLSISNNEMEQKWAY